MNEEEEIEDYPNFELNGVVERFDHHDQGQARERDDVDIDIDIDITAEEVWRLGVDMQGIPWEVTPYTRESYRVKRDMDYKSYYNRQQQVSEASSDVLREVTTCKEVPSYARPYQFHRNWRRVKSSIIHFQLRNLVWAPTAHDVYYVDENKVMRFNTLGMSTHRNHQRAEPEVVLDVSGETSTAVAPGLGPIAVCTLCVGEGLVAAGGFGGELVIKRQGTTNRTIDVSIRVSNSENGITNAIDIFRPRSGGGVTLVCSNNDQYIRLYDFSSGGFRQVGEYSMPWAVNCTVASPSGKLLCCVGDDPEGMLMDPTSGSTVAKLRGHYDFSFAAAWHPDGNVVATGNQDLTTRVYDVRLLSRPLHVLRAHIGAVRSLRFSPNGRSLMVAEPADYVTLYDVASGFTRQQTIDLFGELAGVAFTPGGERLYAAISDAHYSSLVQFNASIPHNDPQTIGCWDVDLERIVDAWEIPDEERKRRPPGIYFEYVLAAS
jgi:hypothetical protein